MTLSREVLKEFGANLGFNFSEILDRPLAKPYWVFISLSHNCNLDCQMCGVKKILRNQELDADLVKKNLDEVAGWHSDCVVLFTGGEPFLRKDIFDIIGHSVSLGLKTEVVTNGSQITDPAIVAKIIGSGLGNIAVSLDGFNPQTHDFIRGIRGAHSKAVDAISCLSREKRAKGVGPQISAWTTIMKENIGELYEIIGLAEEIGVECLVYHPVIVAQDDMQNTLKAGRFWLDTKDIDVLTAEIEKIRAYQKKNGLVAFLHDPYLWIKYFKNTLTKEDWRCNPFVFIDIGPDGDVRSCGPAFGNVKEMSLTETLHTPQASKARRRMQCCQKPCLQTCWARPEVDNLAAMVEDFIQKIENSVIRSEEKSRMIKEGLALLAGYEDLLAKERKNIHGRQT